MEKIMMLVLMGIICLNVFLPPLMRFLGFKVRMDILSCGLTGYCGNVPADPSIIKMIMMYNEERGEDSTGWAVNDEILKETDKVTKFIANNPLIITPEQKNYTIIAHARKCSSGVKYSKELAHPFGIRNNEEEKDTPFDLILAMNGTLTNTTLLSEKFHVEYTQNKNSDTQVLSRIMAKLGAEDFKNALELYDGTGTLLFYFPNSRKNRLYVYKDTERPLHCWHKGKNEIYLSSMPESLQAAGAKKEDIKFFEGNNLYTLEDGIIVGKEIVARTPLKPIASFASVKNRTARSRAEYYNSEYFGEYGEMGMSRSALVPPKNTSVISKVNIRGRADDHLSHKDRGNRVYTINERYYRNGHPLTGKNFITDNGKLKTFNEAKTDSNAKPYFFINGYICNSEQDYDSAVNKCKGVDGQFSLEVFKGTKISEFVDYFQYPVLTVSDGTEVWVLNSAYESSTKEKGDKIIFTPFLSDEEFEAIRMNRWTNVTKKVMASVGEVKKAKSLFVMDDLENIMSDDYEKQTERFFLSKLVSEASDSPHFYFSMIKKDLWKVNTSQTLKEYFLVLILKIAKSKDVITKANVDDIVKLAESTEYSGREFTEQMERVISLLRKKVLIENSSAINLEENFSEFSTQERIKIHGNNPGIYSEAEIISTIRETNTFYKSKGFTDSIYNCEEETVEKLRNIWTANCTTDKDLYDFYEAILITLNLCQRVTDNEALYALEEGGKALKDKVELVYKDWHTYMNMIEGIDEDIDDDKPPVDDCTVEEVNQTENSLEELTPEYYYEQFQEEVNELSASMEEIIGRMNQVEKKDKNGKFESLKAKMVQNLLYLKKQVVVLKK